MDQWIEIGTKLGIAGLVIVAVAYAWAKQIWPFIVQQIKDAKAERESVMEAAKAEREAAKAEREAHTRRFEEQGRLFAEVLQREREDKARRFDEQGKMFMEALRTQNILAAETHKESMKAYGEITQEVRALNKHLRNGNGK
jgi:hypothetical protein